MLSEFKLVQYVMFNATCVVFGTADELRSGAAAAGNHVQLFPGAKQRCNPTDHFLRPLQSPRQQG